MILVTGYLLLCLYMCLIVYRMAAEQASEQLVK